MTDDTIRRNSRTVFRRLEVGAGGVLLHLDSGEYRHLNETGALIWDVLETSPTRTELLTELRRIVTNAPVGLDTEVQAFLEALKERGLIEVGHAGD
jgi:hypothetical protein